MNKNLKERIAAFYLAAIITIVVIGFMIIYHEESSEFKELLINLTGHHWVTKSIVAIIMFPVLSMVFYIMFSSEKLRKTLKSENTLLWSIFIFVVIVLFVIGSLMVYVIHFITS